MVYCAGCHRNFKPTGFSLHIQRSKNPLCLAAHYSHLKELEQEEDDAMEEEYDTNDVPQFEGDFFGNYEEDDLDWPSNEDRGSPCVEGKLIALHMVVDSPINCRK